MRCVPQVHGAVRDALDHLRRVLDVELNSATDNPLVFPDGGSVPADALATGGGLVISGGNFHGEPIALALDFAKLALSELGAISERRIALMVDPRLNGGLPGQLVADTAGAAIEQLPRGNRFTLRFRGVGQLEQPGQKGGHLGGFARFDLRPVPLPGQLQRIEAYQCYQ